MPTLAEEFVAHIETERENESLEFIEELKLWQWGDVHWLASTRRFTFIACFELTKTLTWEDREIPKGDLITQFQDGSEARWREADLDWFVN
jgi:hypothetical protein